MPVSAPAVLSLQDRPDLLSAAVQRLREPTALSVLSAQQARCVASYMRLLACPEGTVLLREGEQDPSGGLVLVLDGEVTVENLVGRDAAVVVSVLGPGHLIGEMGLLDGGPRTATCVATTPVTGAGLTRNALRRMMADDPHVAAPLLAAVSQRMAQRMRDTTRQLKVFHQLNAALQGEVDSLQQQLHHVMVGAARRKLKTG